MQESKQETQFRIGGVYRNGNGDGPWKIAYEKQSGIVVLKDVGHTGMELTSGWSLSDGRWLMANDSSMHLIPGELHQVDGKWVPLDAQEESDLPELVKNFQERELRKADPTPADLAMIARDGPAKPNGKPILPGQSFQFFAAPAAKPPIAGLTRVSAQDHRVGGWGFVR